MRILNSVKFLILVILILGISFTYAFMPGDSVSEVSSSTPADVDMEDVQGRMRIIETLTTFHHRVSILEVDGREYLLNSDGGIILLE